MEFISGNIFIRPMVFDQAGSTIEGHAHNFDHTTYVVRGSVRIEALDDAGNLITNSLVIADASNGCTGVSVTTGGERRQLHRANRRQRKHRTQRRDIQPAQQPRGRPVHRRRTRRPAQSHLGAPHRQRRRRRGQRQLCPACAVRHQPVRPAMTLAELVAGKTT